MLVETVSQIHAFRANHSCEVPHDGQTELLKKTGIAPSFSRPMYMPVETGLPVFEQLIMSSAIALSALPAKHTGEMKAV